MHILVSACLKHPPSAWCAACRAKGRMLHLTALSGRHASTRVRCESSKPGPQRGGCMRRHRMSFGDFSHAREAQKAPGLASLVPAMKIAPPAMGKAEAVRAFNGHADGTNDIFHLAAQLIAGVLLRADRIIQGISASGMQSWIYFISIMRC